MSTATMAVVGIWGDHRRIRHVLPSPRSSPGPLWSTHMHALSHKHTPLTRPLQARRRRVSLRLARPHHHRSAPRLGRARVVPVPLLLRFLPRYSQAYPRAPSNPKFAASETKLPNSAFHLRPITGNGCDGAQAPYRALEALENTLRRGRTQLGALRPLRLRRSTPMLHLGEGRGRSLFKALGRPA